MRPQKFVAILLVTLAVFNLAVSKHGSELTASTREIAGLNHSCTSDESCSSEVPNSYCDSEKNGTCDCLPFHVPYVSAEGECKENFNGTNTTQIVSCLPLAHKPGDRCSLDLQCTSGHLGNLSHCQDGTCQCLPNATFIFDLKAFENDSRPFSGPLCRRLAVNLGDPCSTQIPGLPPISLERFNPDCKNIPHSICIEEKCTCEPGWIASRADKTKCVQIARWIGMACDTDESQCDLLDNAYCNATKKLCECPATLVANATNSGCVGKVGILNATCTVQGQCTVANSFCEWDIRGSNTTTCQCIAGFVPSGERNDTCLEIRRDVGRQCNETIQCTLGLGQYSECIENECRCSNYSILHNRQCHRLVPLGQKCSFKEQCDSTSASISEHVALSCDFDHSEINAPTYRCCCPSKTHEEVFGRCLKLPSSGSFSVVGSVAAILAPIISSVLISFVIT